MIVTSYSKYTPSKLFEKNMPKTMDSYKKYKKISILPPSFKGKSLSKSIIVILPKVLKKMILKCA